MSTLGERLKKIRNHNGITQKEVAIFLEMTPNAYQKYELNTREPSLETLDKLADFFQVPVDYLLDRNLFKQQELVIQYRENLQEYLDEVISNSEITERTKTLSDFDFVIALSHFITKIDVDEDAGTMNVYFCI